MKDKLVKTGHKRFYYILKKSTITAGMFVAVGLVVAFPTYITMTNIESDTLHAQEKISSSNSDNNTNTDSNLTYEFDEEK